MTIDEAVKKLFNPSRNSKARAKRRAFRLGLQFAAKHLCEAAEADPAITDKLLRLAEEIEHLANVNHGEESVKDKGIFLSMFLPAEKQFLIRKIARQIERQGRGPVDGLDDDRPDLNEQFAPFSRVRDQRRHGVSGAGSDRQNLENQVSNDEARNVTVGDWCDIAIPENGEGTPVGT